MGDPIFNSEDTIVAELDSSLTTLRWEWDPIVMTWFDKGYSGDFVEGKVRAIYTDRDAIPFVVSITFEIAGESMEFNVPLNNHPAHDNTQWEWPGFPIPKPKKNVSKKCTCGCDSIYGPNNLTHIDYCDKYVR